MERLYTLPTAYEYLKLNDGRDPYTVPAFIKYAQHHREGTM